MEVPVQLFASVFNEKIAEGLLEVVEKEEEFLGNKVCLMKRSIYDYDFDKMTEAQYQQCLHSLDGHIPDFVLVSFQASQECTEKLFFVVEQILLHQPCR